MWEKPVVPCSQPYYPLDQGTNGSLSYSRLDILRCTLRLPRSPAGMLSVIWHHGEKLSQEQRAALDAPRPEVTLSCFYALRGQSTVQDRRKKDGGGKCILGGTKKSKARPWRWRRPGLVYVQKWWEGRLLLIQLKWKRVRWNVVLTEPGTLWCLWIILYGQSQYKSARYEQMLLRDAFRWPSETAKTVLSLYSSLSILYNV